MLEDHADPSAHRLQILLRQPGDVAAFDLDPSTVGSLQSIEAADQR